MVERARLRIKNALRARVTGPHRLVELPRVLSGPLERKDPDAWAAEAVCLWFPAGGSRLVFTITGSFGFNLLHFLCLPVTLVTFSSKHIFDLPVIEQPTILLQAEFALKLKDKNNRVICLKCIFDDF